MCVIFAVANDRPIAAVRYNGVYSGNRGKGGYNHDEWAAWFLT